MNRGMIEVLEQATSQDTAILKLAEETLSSWETQKGYYTALYNVFSDHSVAFNVRFMAIICFKNGVDRYWRRNAPNGINEDEKEFLRHSLISKFDEPVNQLAVQLSVTIGKISRYDWPREWDNLIPTLLDNISQQNKLVQHRALLTLHNVVKTLASKRLSSDIAYFKLLTQNTFSFILNLWNNYTESFLILISNENDNQHQLQLQIQEELQLALLCLRILRKFILHGLDKLSKSDDAMLFIKIIFQRARAFIECRKNFICRNICPDIIDTLEKIIIHLTKVLFGVSQKHQLSYCEFLPMSIEFTVYYCFTDDGKSYSFTKFIIQCFNLFKECIQIVLVLKYEENLFTPEIVKQVCTQLITHYFLLTQSDLEMWDNDPENFAIEDTHESSKYNLRPRSQSIFQFLFSYNRDIMIPIVIELMQKYYHPVDPNDLHSILMKDAVYLAVGLLASDLYDDVDFNQWFSTTLNQELEIKNNNYRIIKRRVWWLIGKWFGIKLCETLKPLFYKIIIKSISSQEDIVVRLEASITLKQALDDFRFDRKEFAPFIESTFSVLFNLLQHVTECDNKMQILDVMSFVIERVLYDIKPYIGPLSTYLPSLWQTSGSHYMMKCAIITILIQCVKALRSESIILEPMIANMISVSCDLNESAHVYLMEDGMELWLTFLENLETLTPGISHLFRNMPALLDSGLDLITFKSAVAIIQAYILLCPQDIFCELGNRIIEGIDAVYADLRPQEALEVNEMLLLILKIAPEQGIQLTRPLLMRAFKTIYIDSISSIQIKLVCVYLDITSRILLHSKETFSQIIIGIARELEKTEESVLGKIIDFWLAYLPCMDTDLLKILGLALCSLLNANSPPIVFQNFPSIISSIVEILNDLTKTDATGVICCYEKNNSTENNFIINEEEVDYRNQHELRVEKLDNQDPSLNVCLKDSLQDQLNTFRRSLAENQFDSIISSLPPEVETQLRVFITF